MIIISLHQIPSIVFKKYFSKIQLPFNGLPGSCRNLIVRCVWRLDIILASGWHHRCHLVLLPPALHCPPDDSDHSLSFLPNIKSQHLERESFHLCWPWWPAVRVERRGEVRVLTLCYISVTPFWHMCSHPHQWMTIRPKHLSYKNWKQYSPPTGLESLTPISHTAGPDEKYLSQSQE